MSARYLQAVQPLAMVATPFVLGSNVAGGSAHWAETTTIWSCVVIAILLVGMSLCAIANAIADRN